MKVKRLKDAVQKSNIKRTIRDDELCHYGIKGMEWKHHKAKQQETQTVYTNRRKITTGKSKGVHKREKIQSTNYNGNVSGWSNNIDYDPRMKKTQSNSQQRKPHLEQTLVALL